MKQINADSITKDTKAWFGTLMQGLAIRHDLAGPEIKRVSVETYKQQLIDEITRQAKAAIKAKELELATDDLAGYCTLAAEELIRIRQIRAAHKSGELSTEVLKQLPLYPGFQDYFDENPDLFYDELVAAAKELFNLRKDDAGTDSLSQPGHPKHPVSKATRGWIEVQVLGLACADDAWGARFGTVAKDVYITDCTLRLRKNARHAIRIGDLNAPAEDLDKICWVAACEAYLLRSLKAAKDAGKLTEQQIRAMPIYGPYHEYFEIGSQLAAMAQNVAGSAGVSIQPPGAKN
ncbi:MAG TPA: hypothetical protein VFE51_15630 [Verrucomicrobiae bacterium]|nr:hypothetical protein [Verrucomicrobiae bacterium]